MVTEESTSVILDLDRAAPVAKRTICLLFPLHILTDHLPHGDGLVAFGFISELARRGHRLHVIAQRFELAQPLPNNVSTYQICTKPGMGKRLSFLFESRAIVRRLRGREKIDLIHQLNPVCSGMSLGMIGLGLPIVLGTFVGAWPSEEAKHARLPARVMKMMKRCALLAITFLQEMVASAFLVTTPAALTRLSSQRRVRERTYWIAHGIDTAFFSEAVSSATTSRNSILFLASIAVKKGIFTLLDAFEMIHAALPDVELHIAGDGPSLGDVKSKVASMVASSNVHLLGRLDRASVRAVMARTSVYCLPSFGEPYATTVIEAMACGKPVVVTDSGGLRYMVSDEGGRRVEPGNAAELATALIEILSSPAMSQKMGAYNRERALREYDWARVIQNLENAYNTVLDRHASKPRI